MYLDAKEEQKSGRKPIAPSPFEDLGVGSGGDTLTALPVIQAGNGTSPGDRAREREERLRKRVSAGGRLVKQSGSGGGY
jgi:Arf-GAP/SH3 domain/ANK repeat/PH domain-containing protein